MRILAVTGSTGFIGRQFVQRAAREQFTIRRLLRRHAPSVAAANVVDVLVGDLGQEPDWRRALEGVEVVVHLAAIAHRPGVSDSAALEQLRRVNVTAVGELARAAADAGVRRVVLLSSVGVHGATTPDRPFSESDPPAPHDQYSWSKLDAERALADVADARGLEFVILRSPLVYGAGAPGNFGRLLKLAGSGLPLPLAAVRNRRSLISIDNLCDLLIHAAIDPAARNEVFLVSDGDAISTPELIRGLAEAQGRPCRLFALPVGVLRGLMLLIGRSKDFERLCGSLEIDSSKVRERLGWSPLQTPAEGLRKAVGPDRPR